MIATTIQELDSLRDGTLDVTKPLSFDQMPLSTLINELSASHGYVFQQRSIGKKVEIGIARRVEFQMIVRASHRSIFWTSRLCPVLFDCYLLSGYNDIVSEVTWAKRIRVWPVSPRKGEVSLAMWPGHKLDKSEEGWTLKALKRRKTKLSEKLLRDRGWQFDLVPPVRVG